VEGAQASLLAEAGTTNGEGFPKLTLKLRAEGPTPLAVAQAYAAALKESLGIEVEVNNMDFKAFMDELNAKPTGVQFTLISYGMDYLDPSNMLGVFLSGGRHSWSNAEYDSLVPRCVELHRDPAERVQMSRRPRRSWSTTPPLSSPTTRPPAI
jgi:peptide/nickel transport system substrate-binding protein/oligopeptide transport system substrate-binding protein